MFKAAGYVVLVFCISVAIPVQAQERTGNIEGRVVTSDGRGVESIAVAVLGTSRGTVTNARGEFEIRGVRPGTYVLAVSYVGLETQKVEVDVRAGETTRIPPITLNNDVAELQEVLVVAERNQYKVARPSPSLRIQAPLIEQPQNIQVVTQEVLADQQIFDMLEGVTRNVSGVTRAEHWDNYARIYMRGTNISAFRNGMNVSMPWGPLAEDMSMVERIEFVKGPAGFMLASGEPGGFYNVVTRKPTGITRRALGVAVGSFDTYRATADFDGMLSKDRKLLYRLNLMGQLENSFVRYDFNDRFSIAPVLRYDLSDRTSATLEYTYQYSRMLAPGAGYQFSNEGYKDVPRTFTIADPSIDPTFIGEHSAFFNVTHRLSSTWKLTSQLGYFHYNMLGSSLWPESIDEEGNMVRGLSSWDAFSENKLGQIYVNGDVRTGAVGHRILAGIDMGNKDYLADFGQYFTLGSAERFNIYHPEYGLPADSIPRIDRSRSLRDRANYEEAQRYAAFYVQDELQLWQNRVRLTLAGRYTISRDDYRYGAEEDNSYASDRVFTPRIGLSVSIDPQTSVYALYDQAYVPQIGADFSGNKFDPITGGNIEMGLKRDWFGGAWNSTVSAYHITKNNVLTGDPEHPDFSIQLGQIVSQGVEVDVRGEIVRGLEAVLNYAYNDSRITDDTNPETIGNATPGSTRHVTNGWLSYRLSRGLLDGVGISLGYQWQVDRAAWYAFDGNEQPLPDYFRLDGGISWANERLSVALNVNNLLNEYLFSGAPYPWGGYYYWVSEAPRNFRLTVGYAF